MKGEKKSVPFSCNKLNEQRVNKQIKSSAFMQSILLTILKRRHVIRGG